MVCTLVYDVIEDCSGSLPNLTSPGRGYHCMIGLHILANPGEVYKVDESANP